MEKLVDRESALWDFLSDELHSLIEDGERLLEEARNHPIKLHDHSYLVFPFAKVYEGFLKSFLLSENLISQSQYESDHFRIGKVLNPNLPDHLRLEGLYDKVCRHVGNEDLALRFWNTWKRGRNLLFHYFPGKHQMVPFAEAEKIIYEIIQTMESAVRACNLPRSKLEVENLKG